MTERDGSFGGGAGGKGLGLWKRKGAGCAGGPQGPYELSLWASEERQTRSCCRPNEPRMRRQGGAATTEFMGLRSRCRPKVGVQRGPCFPSSSSLGLAPPTGGSCRGGSGLDRRGERRFQAQVHRAGSGMMTE